MCVSPSVDVLSSETGPSRQKKKKKRDSSLLANAWRRWAEVREVGNCSVTADWRRPCEAAHPLWPHLWPPVLFTDVAAPESEERASLELVSLWPMQAHGSFQTVAPQRAPKGVAEPEKRSKGGRIISGRAGVTDKCSGVLCPTLASWMHSDHHLLYCSSCLASLAPTCHWHKTGKQGELERTWKLSGFTQHFHERPLYARPWGYRD